jgi:uncharacterized protein with HEPN domain
LSHKAFRGHKTVQARILEYTGGPDQSGCEESAITYDATLRNPELIGEAATRIPQSVRDASRDIPWRQIIATRNRLIHAYLGIDNDTLWSIIRDDVPDLRVTLRRLRQDPPTDRKRSRPAGSARAIGPALPRAARWGGAAIAFRAVRLLADCVAASSAQHGESG